MVHFIVTSCSHLSLIKAFACWGWQNKPTPSQNDPTWYETLFIEETWRAIEHGNSSGTYALASASNGYWHFTHCMRIVKYFKCKYFYNTQKLNFFIIFKINICYIKDLLVITDIKNTRVVKIFKKIIWSGWKILFCNREICRKFIIPFLTNANSF